MATSEEKTGGKDGGGGDLTRLARGGSLNLVGAVLAGVMGFALVVVVTHTYSQQTAGAFFAAVSLFVILAAICGLGTDAGLVRWLPRHLALGRAAAARRTVPIALLPVFALAATAALALAVAAPALAALLGEQQTAEVTTMLRVLAGFLPVATAHDLLLAATRGHGTMRPTVLIEKIFRQTAQVSGAALAGLLTDHPVALALAWALPYLPGLAAAALWYRALARRSDARIGPGEMVQRAELISGFWRYTAPRAGAQICQTALQRADIMLLAALSSPRNAAIYTAATRFIVIGQLATQAIQQVMQPMVSRQLTLEDRAGAQRVFATSTAWIVMATWPVHLTVAVGAPVYLSLFGEGYAGAGQTTTVLLALTMLLATACGPVDVMLLMAGRSGLSLANNVAALAVNLALNLLLIPDHGATGAAIAWSAALVTRNLLPLLQVRAMLSMTPFSSALLWATASVSLCFGGISLLARLLFGSNIGGLAAGLALACPAYLALLWAGRERLALTAFASLVPGRLAARTAPTPDHPTARRAHVSGH